MPEKASMGTIDFIRVSFSQSLGAWASSGSGKLRVSSLAAPQTSKKSALLRGHQVAWEFLFLKSAKSIHMRQNQGWYWMEI